MKWFISITLFLITLSEIWCFLTLGQLLGAGWTTAWVLVSFVTGLVLLRWEGLAVLGQIHQQLLSEVIPTRELLDMLFIVAGAGLLILPGFITDVLGLGMLLPPVRWFYRVAALAVMRRILARMAVTREFTPPGQAINVTPAEETRQDLP